MYKVTVKLQTGVKKEITFHDIKLGEYFLYHDNIYLKHTQVRSICTDMSHYYYYNSIKVDTGNFFNFNDPLAVVKISAQYKIVIAIEEKT